MALHIVLSEQQAAGLAEVFELAERGREDFLQQAAYGDCGTRQLAAAQTRWVAARESMRVIGAQLACQPTQGAAQALSQWAQVMAGVDTTGMWESFTCEELEATAHLARIAGREEVAQMMINLHALGDYDPEDQHHELYLKHQREERERMMHQRSTGA